MPELTDSKVQSLLESKRSELEGKTPEPTEQPEAQEKATETAGTEETGAADKAPEQASNTEGEAEKALPKEETKAKGGPDLTWLEAEYRETYKALPEPLQKQFRTMRAAVLTASNERYQKASELEKDAAFAREVKKDKDFMADVLAARKARLERASSPEKAAPKTKPKWADTLLAGDEETIDKTVRDVIREETVPLVRQMLEADDVHRQKVDDAVVDYMEGVTDVDAAVKKAALTALTQDLADANDGKPHKGIQPEQVALVLPGYLRAAKAEAAVKAAEAQKTSNPTVTTARTTSIKGLGPQGPSKPMPPKYVTEKRAPTVDEYWKAKVTEAGLTDEQLTALRAGGSLSIVR